MTSAEDLHNKIALVRTPEQIPKCCKELEKLFREIEDLPFQFSSVFCKCFLELLDKFFCTTENTANKVGWLDNAPTIIENLCCSRGGFFKVIFGFDDHASYPMEISVKRLPQTSQWLLQNPTATFPHLSKLYRRKNRRTTSTTELNMCSCFFVHYALHALYHTPKAQPRSHMWHTPGLPFAHGQPRKTKTSRDVYITLLKGYLNYFLPNDNSRESLQPKPHAQQFVLSLSEVWLNQNSAFFELPTFRPPTQLSLDCITLLITHLVSDPNVRYMRKGGRTKAQLVDSVLTCMTEELQLVQQPLFNFLLCTLNGFDKEVPTPQLSQTLDIWLAFITPWGKTDDPRGYYPYVVCNFPFYTVLVVQFLEILCKLCLDIRYKSENKSKSNTQKSNKTLNFLNKIERLLGTIAGLSFADNDSLSGLLPELEKRLLRRAGRSQKAKLPFDCPELHSLLLGAHRALLPPDRPPRALFPDASQTNTNTNTRMFERLLDVFEPGAIPAASAKPCESIIKHFCVIFNQTYQPRSPRSPRLSNESVNLNGKTEKKLDHHFKSQWLMGHAPSWLPSFAVENLPTFLVDKIVSQPRRPKGWTPYADEDDQGALTVKGRELLLRGQRVCSNLDVEFEGDEWDRPVRSWESAVMVVLAKWLSQYLNYKIGSDRINLRFMASYQTLLILFVFFLWFWLF